MTRNWMILFSWISEEVKTIETEISGIRGWGWGYELRGLQGKFEEWWWWLHNYYFCQNGVFFKTLCCAKSLQFSSVRVAQSCPTLCDPMNRSTPGFPVHNQLPEFTQTHVHRVGDAIQPSHPLSSPSAAPNPSQHQSIFQWVNSSHEVAKVLEFQL